jgi:hypothetical protein
MDAVVLYGDVAFDEYFACVNTSRFCVLVVHAVLGRDVASWGK